MQELKPINRTNVSQAIIDQVVLMICQGSLKPGDRLPSERQLCEVLKVGRSSVRESLKVLETVGVVIRKQNLTILRDTRELNSSILNLSASFSKINEVFETRTLIEVEIVSLAVKRASAENIKALAEAIVETEDLDEFIQSDINFHRCIAESARNNILSQVYTMIMDLIFQTHGFYSRMKQCDENIVKEFLKESTKSHKMILQAFEARSVRNAKREILVHLELAEKTLLTNFKLSK